ncbi:MAG: two-component sensor histidine kinase [Microthrixaceae bacterium]|nr:two-component sensor histidine kinase [Microthrixaceae bacterium]
MAVLLSVLLVVAVGAAWYWRGVATAAGTAVAAVAAVAEAPPAGDAESAGSGGERDDLLAERLRAVVDHLQWAVVIWDAEGPEIYRNRVARAMFEARDSQVLVAAAIEELRADALAGRSVRREVDVFGPPVGSFLVVARPFRVRSLDDPGAPGAAQVDGAVAMVEDRTLQRRIETVRRDFVANISHELKTPIGAVGLLAETVIDEPDPAVVERLATRMIAETDRLGRTVDDLLELSSIEFGDDAEFEDVELAALVAEAEDRLGSAPAQAGIEIRRDVPTGVVIHGDRRQLVSALANLVDNAVKYSADGSEITVGATVAGAGEDDPEGTVLLSVADAGIGVPRRDLDRIFERFYRVDRARSRRTGGTGLGLAIVRHVAANHGGDVRVESTEGVGSVFTLVLPPRRSAPPERPGLPDGSGPSDRSDGGDER